MWVSLVWSKLLSSVKWCVWHNLIALIRNMTKGSPKTEHSGTHHVSVLKPLIDISFMLNIYL